MANSLPQKSETIGVKRKNKRHSKVLGSLNQSIKFFLSYGIIGSFGGIFSYPKELFIIILVVVWSYAFIAAACKFWNSLKPNWWVESFVIISLPILFLGITIHALYYVISGWIWLLPLLATFIIALILPVIDLPLAKAINKEQFAPHTRLGKGCMNIGLGLVGISGVLGASFGLYGGRLYGKNTVMLVVGVLFAFVSVAMTQTYAYQIWIKRPWRQKIADIQTKRIPDTS